MMMYLTCSLIFHKTPISSSEKPSDRHKNHAPVHQVNWVGRCQLVLLITCWVERARAGVMKAGAFVSVVCLCLVPHHQVKDCDLLLTLASSTTPPPALIFHLPRPTQVDPPGSINVSSS